MEIRLNLEGLGINPESFFNLCTNDLLSKQTVYVTLGQNINYNRPYDVDPSCIVGKVNSVNDDVADISLLDTGYTSKFARMMLVCDPHAAYISPLGIADNDGTVKYLISFGLYFDSEKINNLEVNKK
jgi:hypothetical protein